MNQIVLISVLWIYKLIKKNDCKKGILKVSSFEIINFFFFRVAEREVVVTLNPFNFPLNWPLWLVLSPWLVMK